MNTKTGHIPFCYSAIRSIKYAVKDIYQEKGQRAKKVMSDSPGLVDFVIGLVSSVFNLPDGQVMFFGQFQL